MNGSVVIGYDGSADSEAALAWGLAFADRHRTPVHIVQGFDPSQHTMRLDGGRGPMLPRSFTHRPAGSSRRPETAARTATRSLRSARSSSRPHPKTC
jgi:Universal stress protein family